MIKPRDNTLNLEFSNLLNMMVRYWRIVVTHQIQQVIVQ